MLEHINITYPIINFLALPILSSTFVSHCASMCGKCNVLCLVTHAIHTNVKFSTLTTHAHKYKHNAFTTVSQAHIGNLAGVLLLRYSFIYAIHMVGAASTKSEHTIYDACLFKLFIFVVLQPNVCRSHECRVCVSVCVCV